MKNLLVLVLSFLCTIVCPAQSDVIESKYTLDSVGIEDLMFGYVPPASSSIAQIRQPFGTQIEIEEFLKYITYQNLSNIPSTIFTWLNHNLGNYTDNSAIIFIRHPLVLTQLFNKIDSTSYKKYIAKCSHYSNLKLNISKIDTAMRNELTLYTKQTDSIAAVDFEINTLNDDKVKNKKVILEKEKIITTLNNSNEKLLNLISTKKTILDQFYADTTILYKELINLQEKINLSISSIQEDTNSISVTVLSKDNYEWSEYLLEKKNIMIIALGGISSLKLGSLQITNGNKQYIDDFNDLITLYKSSTGLDLTYFLDESLSKSDCTPSTESHSKIPLSFLLLNRTKINSPSTIEITNLQEKKVLAQVHEKSYFGIKVGASVNNIERKNFLLNDSKLTIQTDSLDSEELKLNMMALFELYPFGRDYDRLVSMFEKNNIPVYERFGLVAGLKISDDPLSDIFMGGSIAVSKSINFVGGIAFHRTAENIKGLEVGENASIDYLLENADKEYKPTLFLGLSISPGQVLKLLRK